MQENKNHSLIETLQERGVKPTAMRLLVLQCLIGSSEALTLRQIEEKLIEADRSTIFRTLTLFEQQHLIHSINDGSGSTRYEFCRSHYHNTHDDRHPHFRCVHCQRTICLTELKIPSIVLPEGYQVDQVNYIITGICPDCAAAKGSL